MSSFRQEAFFEGRQHAFTVLGEVLTSRLRYDNLTSAVAESGTRAEATCAAVPHVE